VTLLFEQFEIARLSFWMPSVLSCFAWGRTTAVVVDCGEMACSAVALYEGHPILHACQRSRIGGRIVIDEWYIEVMERTYSPYSSSYDPLTWSPAPQSPYRLTENMMQLLGRVSLDEQSEVDVPDKSYELPDGAIISVTREQIHAQEYLFKPSIFNRPEPGIHELCYRALSPFLFGHQHFDGIHLPDSDQLYLSLLPPELLCMIEKYFPPYTPLSTTYCKNVLLTGGLTELPGLSERFTQDMKSLLPTEFRPSLRVVSQNRLDGPHGAWMGGSILGSLSVMNELFVTRKDYEEIGPSIVRWRCF